MCWCWIWLCCDILFLFLIKLEVRTMTLSPSVDVKITRGIPLLWQIIMRYLYHPLALCILSLLFFHFIYVPIYIYIIYHDIYLFYIYYFFTAIYNWYSFIIIYILYILLHLFMICLINLMKSACVSVCITFIYSEDYVPYLKCSTEVIYSNWKLMYIYMHN